MRAGRARAGRRRAARGSAGMRRPRPPPRSATSGAPASRIASFGFGSSRSRSAASTTRITPSATASSTRSATIVPRMVPLRRLHFSPPSRRRPAAARPRAPAARCCPCSRPARARRRRRARPSRPSGAGSAPQRSARISVATAYSASAPTSAIHPAERAGEGRRFLFVAHHTTPAIGIEPDGERGRRLVRWDTREGPARVSEPCA